MVLVMKLRYSILIQWSDEDQCYIVSFAEFGKYTTCGIPLELSRSYLDTIYCLDI